MDILFILHSPFIQYVVWKVTENIFYSLSYSAAFGIFYVFAWWGKNNDFRIEREKFKETLNKSTK